MNEQKRRKWTQNLNSLSVPSDKVNNGLIDEDFDLFFIHSIITKTFIYGSSSQQNEVKSFQPSQFDY